MLGPVPTSKSALHYKLVPTFLTFAFRTTYLIELRLGIFRTSKKKHLVDDKKKNTIWYLKQVSKTSTRTRDCKITFDQNIIDFKAEVSVLSYTPLSFKTKAVSY